MNVVNRCEQCDEVFQHKVGDGEEMCRKCRPRVPKERYVLAVTDDMRTQERLTRLASTPLHKRYPEMTTGLAWMQEQRPSAEAWKRGCGS